MGITALQLITDAGRKARILGSGEQFDGSEAMDALRALKMMLDSWSLEELMIPYRTRESFALDGSGSYTMGPGGDWDTVAPMAISEVSIVDGAGQEWSLTETSLNQWVSFGDVTTAGRPAYFHHERGFPLQTIHLSSLPVEPTIRMWSYKPIAAWQIEDLDFPTPNPTFSGQEIPTSALDDKTLTADIEFDQGYEMAIVYNLALHLSADYNRQMHPVVVAVAHDSKALIKRRNIEVPMAKMDGGLSSQAAFYDIVKGP